MKDDEETVVYRARLTLHAQDRQDIEADDQAREDAFDDLKQALSYGSTPHRAS